MQKKTQRPVQFEINEQTRDAVADRVKEAHLKPEQFLFPSRVADSPIFRPGSTPGSGLGSRQLAWTRRPTGRTRCDAPRPS